MLTFDFVGPQPTRPAAVAGTWYPERPADLVQAIDGYFARVDTTLPGEIVGLVAPHAGLVYSGPVAAHAYRQLSGRSYDVIVLVGPSHYAGFDGVAVYARGAFETPLGRIPIAEDIASAIVRDVEVARDLAGPHGREHSLEMQLPFLQSVLPGTPIVPMLMGRQTPAVMAALGDGLAPVLAGRRALAVASSDLSHYHDARTAARLDRVVIEAIARFDPEGLAQALELFPEHACGGGPMVAVMRVARALGARSARVLCYADSGDVSGDKDAVVGYAAAVLGTFDEPPAPPEAPS
ncbi:MAG: AmmeMemoRadiSam system protein B [Acidobacteriota bacterium]